MSMKNKKLPNCIRLVLNINLLSKKLPPTQNFTKIAKICIKTDLERRRVKQIYQKYHQKNRHYTYNQFWGFLLHYLSMKKIGEFFSEKIWSDFLKKFIFTDLDLKMTAHIDVASFQCLNYLILRKKLEKNYAAYAKTCRKIQKSRKMRFFHHRVK